MSEREYEEYMRLQELLCELDEAQAMSDLEAELDEMCAGYVL